MLSADPFALLIGMLLDQQVPMETAFAGPAKLRDRLGAVDAHTLQRIEADELAEVFRRSPAVHRYPGSMAGRVQALAGAVVDDWGGDAAEIWTRGDPGGAEVLRRLKALPGFGDQKARIFLALLGKQVGFRGAGWQEAAGAYAEPGYRSVADITDPESLDRVRAHKRAQKAAARAG